MFVMLDKAGFQPFGGGQQEVRLAQHLQPVAGNQAHGLGQGLQLTRHPVGALAGEGRRFIQPARAGGRGDHLALARIDAQADAAGAGIDPQAHGGAGHLNQVAGHEAGRWRA